MPGLHVRYTWALRAVPGSTRGPGLYAVPGYTGRSRLYVRSRENTAAQRTADVGHHPLKERVVGRSVVDDVIAALVMQLVGALVIRHIINIKV